MDGSNPDQEHNAPDLSEVHLMLTLASGERLEVQIRTRCMHEDAEHGGARHADYKASSLSAAPAAAISA